MSTRKHDARRTLLISDLPVYLVSWHRNDNFSSGPVCLVLASEMSDAADYVRDYDQFLKAAQG